jgi:hypothetical protein
MRLALSPRLRQIPPIAAMALVGSIAAMAQTPGISPTADPAAPLFARSLADIERLYVEPVSVPLLAMSGAMQLHSLDSRVAVTDHLAGAPPGTLTLLYDDRDAADFPLPAEHDAAGWGDAIGELIAAARRVSPRLAAMQQGQIEDVMFDGIVDTLDPFSRYVPPSAAAADVTTREGLGDIGGGAEAGVVSSRDGSILVLRIAAFARNTTGQVAAALAAVQRPRPPSGIVLDLRGNPGGLLDQAVGLAGLFLPNGPIVSTVGRIAASDQYFAASGRVAVALRVPMAVLINGGTASAAEIVAAALQDAGRAVVVGSASYGKGTVQDVLRLPNGGELILTWARLIARGGYRMQHHGVVPTLCTALLPNDSGPIAVSMQQAAAVAFAAPRPRAGLDDTDWVRLRRSCPPLATQPPVDLALAERLLANSQLYAAALSALPAAAP